MSRTVFPYNYIKIPVDPERCLARYSYGDESDCYGLTVGNTYKVVETSRLETRATEFVLYASVLHANEECEAKAIFTTYLS